MKTEYQNIIEEIMNRRGKVEAFMGKTEKSTNHKKMDRFDYIKT